MIKGNEKELDRAALRLPLIHIAADPLKEIDKSRPVPPLCFLGEKNPKYMASEAQRATCKICITLLCTRIENLRQQASFLQGKRKAKLLEKICDLHELLPLQD